MSNATEGASYSEMRRHNARCVDIINKTWGSTVARVEDVMVVQTYRGKRGELVRYEAKVPSIKSKTINGRVAGLASPPFFAGPAKGL
jgi:hypothetical protein